MKLLDGKKTANDIKAELKKEVAELIDKNHDAPHLAAILVGNDPASATYVAAKEKACNQVGMTSSVYKLDEHISEKELLETIEYINRDEEIHGLIVQLPLPEHIDEQKVIETISPDKDVDGFHPLNLGKMLSGMPAFLPATPYGIMQLIERNNIEVGGKHCVIVGRSKIVGSPLSVLLSQKRENANATVTLCHSRTQDLPAITSQGDVLIAAVGVAGMITADMVKKDAIIIDVGIHRIEDSSKKNGYRLCGDVDFIPVSRKAKAITPVPGGVGPMTIVSLLKNTLLAAKKQKQAG